MIKPLAGEAAAVLLQDGSAWELGQFRAVYRPGDDGPRKVTLELAAISVTVHGAQVITATLTWRDDTGTEEMESITYTGPALVTWAQPTAHQLESAAHWRSSALLWGQIGLDQKRRADALREGVRQAVRELAGLGDGRDAEQRAEAAANWLRGALVAADLNPEGKKEAAAAE